MKTIRVDQLADFALILPVVQAWREFKAYHDITKKEHCCCHRTLKLFHELEELEKELHL